MLQCVGDKQQPASQPHWATRAAPRLKPAQRLAQHHAAAGALGAAAAIRLLLNELGIRFRLGR